MQFLESARMSSLLREVFGVHLHELSIWVSHVADRPGVGTGTINQLGLR